MNNVCEIAQTSFSFTSLCIHGFEMFSVRGAYLVSTIALTIFLYAYIIHLYKSQKSKRVDYEKYGLLAINDSIDDSPIESVSNTRG